MYSFTIGSLVMSQSHTLTLLFLLLAVEESDPLPPHVLDELLAPPFLSLWDPQFL